MRYPTVKSKRNKRKKREEKKREEIRNYIK